MSRGIGGILIDTPSVSHGAGADDSGWLRSLMAAATRARKRRGSVWVCDDLDNALAWSKKNGHSASREDEQQYLRCLELSLNSETIEFLSGPTMVAVFTADAGSGYSYVSDVSTLSVDDGGRAMCFILESKADRLRFLHADSVQSYLDERYGAIQAGTKRFFGNTLGVMLANGAGLVSGDGVLPWDDDFAQVFEQIHDYDLREHLLDLVTERPGAAGHRYRYWSLVADLFKEGFAYSLHRWGEAHKVPCGGFFGSAASLCEELVTTGPRMPLYAQQLYPTIALSPEISIRMQGKSLVSLKQLSSVVHQSETRGAIGIFSQPSTPPSLDEWRATKMWHLAMGVTYFAIDGAHDTRGLAESTRLPNMGALESSWPYVSKHFDGLARLAWMYRRGKSHCEVLFLLPMSSIKASYSIVPSGSDSCRRCEYLDSHLQRLTECLLSHQIDFDFGDEALLALHAHAEHNMISMGTQLYSVVLLPPMTMMRSSTYALLQDFAMSGGRLLVAGTVPHLLDGEPNSDLRSFFEQYAQRITNGIDLFDYSRVIEALTEWDYRTVTASTGESARAEGLLACRRVWEDAEILQLCHVHGKAQRINIAYRSGVTGRVELWDYRDGSMTPVASCTAGESFEICDDWDSFEARSYVFIPEEMQDEAIEPGGVVVERVVDPDWTVIRQSDNATAIKTCRFPGRPWGDRDSAREVLLERLESMPEGVIGSMEWQIPVPIQSLACSRWSVSMFWPDESKVSCGGLELAPSEDDLIPHPGWRTFVLPSDLHDGSSIVVEGKWTSPDQVDTPMLGGDFLEADGEFTNPSPTLSFGPWDAQGLGSYGGRIVYQAEVQGYERFDSSPIYLELEGLQSPAEIRVNGRIVDHILGTPYRCDIRSHWAAGSLNIEVEVSGSWYNALHPEQTPIKQGLERAPTIRIYAQE